MLYMYTHRHPYCYHTAVLIYRGVHTIISFFIWDTGGGGGWGEACYINYSENHSFCCESSCGDMHQLLSRVKGHAVTFEQVCLAGDLVTVNYPQTYCHIDM